jgi:IclR family KDG regulon transcriptional repressor
MSEKTTRSLERGLDILLTFSHESPFLSIEEISMRTGIPRSTCYRLVSTLKQKNLVDLSPDDGRYRLAMGAMKFHAIILESLDVASIARPFIKQLVRITGESVQLILRNKNTAVCIDKVESSEALRVRPDKGTIIGLHSGASGKAIMAFLPIEEQERIIKEVGLKKFGPNTLTDATQLKKNLEEIRRQKYAVSKEEIYVGVTALAAPIFDFEDNAIASVCVAGPMQRLTEDKLASFCGAVVETAKQISHHLGQKIRTID